MYQNIELQGKFSLASQIVAGNIAGWSSITVAQPLDLIKTKCQINQSITLNSISNMIKQKGISSLYRGASSIYFLSGLATALEFGIFQLVKSLELNTNFIQIKKNSTQQLLVSGGATGFLSSFFYTPVQYTKIRTQIDNKPQGSLSRMFSIIYKEKLKGVRRLYTGLSWALIKQVPGSAIYFGGFYIYLSKLSNKPRHEASLIHQVISSSLAAATYIAYSYPLDTIKTNIQSGRSTVKQLIAQKYWKKQSFKLGFKISFLRGMIIDMTALTVYENVRNYISREDLF